MNAQRSVRMPIRALVDVVIARRKAMNMAASLGFVVPEATKVAVVVSELARNIINYAGTGFVSLTALTEGKKGIEIVAEDQGPGIDSLARVLKGGYTTSKGMGVGLSGSKRMMDEFEVRTKLGQGTVITAAKWLPVHSHSERFGMRLK